MCVCVWWWWGHGDTSPPISKEKPPKIFGWIVLLSHSTLQKRPIWSFASGILNILKKKSILVASRGLQRASWKLPFPKTFRRRQKNLPPVEKSRFRQVLMLISPTKKIWIKNISVTRRTTILKNANFLADFRWNTKKTRFFAKMQNMQKIARFLNSEEIFDLNLFYWTRNAV